MEKGIPCKWRSIESQSSYIHVSDKTDFKIKTVIKDKERYYIRRYNNYKYICTQHRSNSIQKANKGEINRNTVVGGDSNTLLSSMDRSSGQKISKETQALNYTLALIDTYRLFHSKAEYTFFSYAHRTFSMTDCKVSLCKSKTEIIPSIFSDHKTMRLEINYNGKKKVASQMAQWQRIPLPVQETQVLSLDQENPWRKRW